MDFYVRIGVGKLLGNPNKDSNKIAQVIDVIETDKGLTLRMGTEERVYRREINRSLPTMGDIHKKMKDIASPVEHNYTNDEVNQLAESIRGEMAREMEGTSEQARVLHGRPPTPTTIEKE
ncbi:hypothetical protein PRIPAC_74626 [Pristionchus pacificus]|uniref:Uncharacterized protein n=1 Tax=Pristionchus pacificus TaxID=54126 RepID=A0A2A6C5A8_PRIPA|nr:hypothetical protein PRIPAC_74626 [Pristionchus pacificus]|eukprot:PDM73296.1 hypothetical protein PRIPAC_40652 [Pristionchus pacificus]